MKKSQFVFAIMAVIYLAIAVFDGFGWLTVTENILLGLSLSALLSAISDILYNIGWARIAYNEFNYIIRVTVEFLSEKQALGIPSMNPNINIKGVMQCVKGMSKNYKSALPPVEYSKKKYIAVIKVCSQISFILSIAVFILLPFLSLPFQGTISTVLTLSAFSAMCLNLFIAEFIADISNRRNDDFMNKEQLIIQTAYPDFLNFLNWKLSPNEDYEPAKET